MNVMEIHSFGFLGWPEIMGILLVMLLLFGAKKLPELAKGLGKGIHEFKKASREVQDELQRAVEEEPPRSPPPPPRPSVAANPTEPAPTAKG